MQFFPTPVSPSFSCPNILFQIMFWNNPHPISPFNAQHHVSHPYKNYTGAITVQNILAPTFSDIRQEDKGLLNKDIKYPLDLHLLSIFS